MAGNRCPIAHARLFGEQFSASLAFSVLGSQTDPISLLRPLPHCSAGSSHRQPPKWCVRSRTVLLHAQPPVCSVQQAARMCTACWHRIVAAVAGQGCSVAQPPGGSSHHQQPSPASIFWPGCSAARQCNGHVIGSDDRRPSLMQQRCRPALPPPAQPVHASFFLAATRSCYLGLALQYVREQWDCLQFASKRIQHFAGDHLCDDQA